MGRVLVCGSATTDMFLDVETGSVEMKAGGFETDLICFPSGSKIQIKELRKQIGGGGVNTAVDLTRLGSRCRYLGKLGSGHNSKKIAKALRTERVEVIATKPSKTEGGFSIIIRSLDGDRTILAYKGANNDLRWRDFNKNKLRGVDWFYLASMVGESYKTIERLSEWAESNDKPSLFNPSSYVVRQGLKYIREVVSKSDIFVVNMEEAQMTLGLRPNAAQLPEAEVDSILKRLHRAGPDIVTVTNGGRRAYVFDGTHKYSTLPYQVDVIDNAGAGDAFSSGFLTAYMRDADLEHAMNTGLACAHSVVKSPETWIQMKDMKAAQDITAEFERRGHRVTRQKLV
jgi:ribokinase